MVLVRWGFNLALSVPNISLFQGSSLGNIIDFKYSISQIQHYELITIQNLVAF